jgi:hypothetical protein
MPALIAPAYVIGDYVKAPTGRQGREGRDFLSPIRQPKGRNNPIHERRPRTYACGGADVYSRPSRPTRPGATTGSRCHRPPVGVHRLLLAAEAAERAL